MGNGEKFANAGDVGDEGRVVHIVEKLFETPATGSREGSRRKGPRRFGPIMSPRTSEYEAALLADIRQIIREELRPVQALLQSMADGSRQPAPAAATAEEMLTVDQVAEAVKVAATTVRMWIHSGQLRAIRPGVGRGPGRTFRVARADLEQFIESVQERVTDSDADARKEAAKILAIVASKRKTLGG
jgi:excisionase family DNA binding protein